MIDLESCQNLKTFVLKLTELWLICALLKKIMIRISEQPPIPGNRQDRCVFQV